MMNEIIDKNNQGAVLLEIGHYKDALTVLNSGLVQLQSYIKHNDGQERSGDALEAAITSDEQGNPDTMEEDTTPATQLDARSTFEKACSEKTARRRGERSEDNADLNQDFVYRHPIRITSESEGENETTDFIKSESGDCENEAALIVVLLFNMALSHHLTALDLEYDHAKRPFLLKGAEKLYKLGYSMQVGQTKVQLSLTYTIATVNNLAQISEELNNTPQSKRLFKHLLISLMIIIDSGATDEIDDMDGFMENASKLILRDCSFAAAA
jgi:hypothetical protein